MNNARRKEIEKAKAMLNSAHEIIEGAQAEEQDAFDNMSEGLQASENGQKIEAAAELLQSALDSIEEALSACDEAME